MLNTKNFGESITYPTGFLKKEYFDFFN